MTMDFDMDGRFALAAGNHAGAPLDWPGLRARFAAAQALQRLIGEATPCGITPAGGSFDRGSARLLALFGAQPGRGEADDSGVVNPTALATGNSDWDKDADVAGACSAGERG